MAVPALRILFPRQALLPFRRGSGRPSRELLAAQERSARRLERAARLFNLAGEIVVLDRQVDELVQQRVTMTPADVLRVRSLLLEVQRLTRLYYQAVAEEKEED